MGALRKFMPITAATFIIGWLAIAGVPPFSGFWSKDEILLFSLAESPALYAVGLITAVLTAFYMTRQIIMVFFGEEHVGRAWPTQEEAPEVAEGEAPVETHDAHGEFKPHESPPIMWIPLVALAGVAALGGLINVPSRSASPGASPTSSRTGCIRSSNSAKPTSRERGRTTTSTCSWRLPSLPR